MTQWRLQSTPDLSIVDGSNVIEFGPLQGDGESGTAANVAMKCYTAYTFTDPRCHCTVFGSPVSAQMRLINGPSFTLSINTVITGTGWVEDVTATDTVAADDTVWWELRESGGMHGDSVSIDAAMITYEHASIDAPIMGGKINIAINVDTYTALKSLSTSTTEANVERLVKRAATASNLRVYITSLSNAEGDTSLRKNQTTSTNLTVTYTTEDGEKEDLTGSESYAIGDDICFFFDDVNVGQWTNPVIQVDFDTPEDVWGAGLSTTATDSFKAFAGDGNTSGSAIDNYDARIGSTTAANLQAYITLAGSASSTIALRVGSTTSANVVVSGDSTGLVEDVTGSEAVGDTDSVTLALHTTSLDTVTASRVEIELPWSAVAEEGVVHNSVHFGHNF